MKTEAFEMKHMVVVVENDPTFLSFWGRVLKEIGIKEFRLFREPIEAKLFLEEIPCRLLISGIVMPDMSGYSLARIASRRNPNCDIVLTSVYGTELSRFNLSGFKFHLIHKPYTDVAALKRFVKHLIDGDSDFGKDLSEDSSSENEDYPQVTEWKL